MKKIYLLCLFFPLPLLATTSANRIESLKNAKAWVQPSWLKDNGKGGFEFDAGFDVVTGPPVAPEDQFLRDNEVNCLMTEKSAKKKSSGQTMKFHCELQTPGHSEPMLKVKYKFDDGEIAGEILGTRLLWALGFGADHMYMIEKINCFGCKEDPFRNPGVDATTLRTPRIFELVAIERKFPGKEIVVGKKTKNVQEGWTFAELDAHLPDAPEERLKEKTAREALKMFSVFVRHSDHKNVNHRLVCLGQKNQQGGCNGPTRAIIHDIGLTFGKGFHGDYLASKAIYPHWDESPIWEDAKNCVGSIGMGIEPQMEAPVITEEGRMFFVKLMRAFSDGPEGRSRVEKFFATAHAEHRMGTIEQWTNTFYRKLNEIEFPTGKKNFVCPTRAGL